MSLRDRYHRLLQVEVGSIQPFIFEGARLRDWRGASALLDRIERSDLPEKLEGVPVDIIRSGGGVIVMGVTEALPDSDVEELLRTVAATYRQEAPGTRVYTAQVDLSKPDADGEGEAVIDLLSRLSFEAERRRGQSPRADEGSELLGPMTRYCDSCGERPAETQRSMGDNHELVCPVCYAKGEHGTRVRIGKAPESMIERFAKFLTRSASGATDESSPAWESVSDIPGLVPGDLSSIAEVDSSNQIALIAADGNRLGQTVQSIGDLDTYRAFSDGVGEMVTRSVFAALARHAPPRAPSKGGKARLPWEIIFLGGDDILLAVASDLAVPLAQAISEEVSIRSRHLFDELDLERDFLSLATGIAIGDATVPIGVLRSLASDLEKSAKKRTYQAAEAGREVHTVDFHRITAQGTTTLSAIRNRELRPRRYHQQAEAQLTMRPFTTAELQRVHETARRWQSAGLPTSKIQYLREHLFESPAEATRAWTHVVGRSSATEKRRAWQDLMRLAPVDDHAPAEGASGDGVPAGDSPGPSSLSIGDAGDASTSGTIQVRAPWLVRPGDGARGTYLLDVIELMELIPREEQDPSAAT
jgi:hypothetical protein